MNLALFTTTAYAFAAIYGNTKFSNMTSLEFSRSHGYKPPPPDQKRSPVFSNIQVSLETPIDWRTKNIVTPVKDQAACGSCWAFSATGNIEGQYAKKYKTLVSFSEQELVSCDTVDSGCMGGLMDNAFRWVQSNGIVTETRYPYTSSSGDTGVCINTNESPIITKIDKFIDIPNDETQMLAYLSEYGPISVAVDATTFQSYISGIVDNCRSAQIDHGVLIVGYEPNSTDGSYPAYWIIKNSWNTNWGEDGYIRIAFGSNQCLITDSPSIVVIN